MRITLQCSLHRRPTYVGQWWARCSVRAANKFRRIPLNAYGLPIYGVSGERFAVMRYADNQRSEPPAA